jgi:hypothetical protein
VLPAEVERRPARGQHRQLPTLTDKFANHGRGCRKMLEIVEYQEHLPGPQMPLQGLLRRLTRDLLDPKRPGENRRKQGGFSQRT